MIDPKALVVSLYKRDFAKIDLSAFSSDYQRKVWVNLGNRCIEEGMLNKALRAYNKAGIEIDKETLTNLIKSVFDKDVIFEPFRNYQHAGIEIDKEKLIKKGFEIAGDYRYNKAREAVNFFKKFDYKSGILKIGDNVFKEIMGKEVDSYDIELYGKLAVWTYEQVGTELPTKHLEILADKLTDVNQHDWAFRALKLLSDRNKTLEVAEKLIKKGNYSKVLKFYNLAGETIDRNKLNEMGNKLLKLGKKRQALKAFQDAGNEQMVQFLKINYGLKD